MVEDDEIRVAIQGEVCWPGMKNGRELDVLERNERGKEKIEGNLNKRHEERSIVEMPIVWTRKGICEMMVQITERDRRKGSTDG